MRMWFGKIPAIGDFCGAAMPQAVEFELDGWISDCLRNCEQLFGQEWLQLYFNAPMSGFYWPPGVCKSLGQNHAVGILMPSVDKAGRAYPLIVLQLLEPQPNPEQTEASLQQWLMKVHAICSQTLEDDWPPEALNQALSELPPLAQRAVQLEIKASETPQAQWFKLQDGGIEQHQLACEGLPNAIQFCQLYGYTAP